MKIYVWRTTKKSSTNFFRKISTTFYTTVLLYPDYALELRDEELNCNKSVHFMSLSIAPLWLNSKAQQSG